MKRSHHTYFLKLINNFPPRSSLCCHSSVVCRFQSSYYYNRLVSNFSTTRTVKGNSISLGRSEKVLTHADNTGNAKMIDISEKKNDKEGCRSCFSRVVRCNSFRAYPQKQARERRCFSSCQNSRDKCS